MATITNEIKNAIINEMEEVLDERKYEYTRNNLEKIVTEWFTKKNKLIDLFSKHPLWNPEKFLIQFDTDMERAICTNEVCNFVNWLRDAANIHYDYWALCQSREYRITNFILHIHTQFFDDSMAYNIEEVNRLNENFKLRTNMKSSKAIGKICREEGWDKLEGFNQKYAALCDCLSPIKVTRHTCISLNPVDFLLMSNGNSWNSCHDIGYADDHGCYSSGTISYMLDEHSFLFYTVDASYDGNSIELEPKIQRQVFGYNDEVIVQLRLYPQSNDSGAKAVYDDIRAIVQKVVSDCLEKPNMWIKSKRDVRDVVSHGCGATCYPDWNHQGNLCSVSTHKEREAGKEFRKIVFGAEPICIECGYRHEYESCISCCDSDYYTCECCGARVHEDDGHYVGDAFYCDDCCSYCEECEEYVPNDEINHVDGWDVCDSCIEYRDYYSCEECGEVHYIDNLVATEDGSFYCNHCASKHTFVCDECGERYHNDSKNHDEETGNYYCDDCYNEILEERKEKEMSLA